MDRDERRRIERFRSNVLGETLAYRQTPAEFDFPGLASIDFFDATAFAGVVALEAETDTVHAELMRVLKANVAEIVPLLQHRVARSGEQKDGVRKWSAIHLIRNGERIEENARLCPETMRLYRELGPPAIAGDRPTSSSRCSIRVRASRRIAASPIRGRSFTCR